MNPIETPLVYPKYKYAAVTLYSLISFINGMNWTTFMPITDASCTILKASHLQIYMLGLTYMIAYPFSSIFVNSIYNKKGLRFGLNIGTILTAVGAIIRCFAFGGYYPVLIGQLLNAIGQPFLINPNAKIINEWFEPKVRAVFITVAACSTLIGNSAGFLIPPAFVKPGATTMKAMTMLLITEASICIAVAIVQVIAFKNSPYAKVAQKVKFCECRSYKELCSNKSFVLLAISSGLGVGNFGTFSTVIEAILLPFGFTSSQASIIGFVITFGGSIESFILGWITDKTRKYKLMYMVSILSTQIVLSLYYPILKSHSLGVLIFTSVVVAPGFIFLTPIAMDYLARLTPDVDEAVSGGLMQSIVQGVTIAEVSICNYLTKQYPGQKGIIYIIIMLAIANLAGVLLGIFVKSPGFTVTLDQSTPRIETNEKTSKKFTDAPESNSATNILSDTKTNANSIPNVLNLPAKTDK